VPWNAKSFAKHNRGLGKAGSAKAAKVANAVLREGGSEGKAIRIANWQAAGRPGRARGGSVEPRRPPPGPRSEDIDREQEPLLNPQADPKSGGRGIVPYARGGPMGGPPGRSGEYLTGEAGPELMVPQDGSPPAMVGRRGPEVIRPTKRGSIVPNHELRRLGKKYARRQGGGPVRNGQAGPPRVSPGTQTIRPPPRLHDWSEFDRQLEEGLNKILPPRQRGGPVEPLDTPQAGFRPGGRQEDDLVKRGIISNKQREKHLKKYAAIEGSAEDERQDRAQMQRRSSKHGWSKTETETTPIDAATR